jgi:hypothetical protein
MLPRPQIRGSPSICGYIIMLTIKTIKKRRTIYVRVMPRHPALTMTQSEHGSLRFLLCVLRACSSLILSLYLFFRRDNTPAYFSSLSSHFADLHTSVLGPSASEV